MNEIEILKKIVELVKSYDKEIDKVHAVVLIPGYLNKKSYKMFISAETLNELNPFDATLSVVKFFNKKDKDNHNYIETINCVHTEDETIQVVREHMKEEDTHFIVKPENETYIFGTIFETNVILLKF